MNERECAVVIVDPARTDLTPADLACKAELQKSGTFSGSVKACRQAVKGIRALTGSGGGLVFSSASFLLASKASSSSVGNKKSDNVVTC